MIRKTVRQMLTAQIFAALTVSVCLLIDSIMIGRFLGEEALAAYGLANPALLAIGAVGSLLSAGIQVACSRSLGRGLQEETNAGFSSAVFIGGAISTAFTIAVLVFRSPLATALGAHRSGALFDNTRDYLTGFSIGAPASMGALILVPFLQIAGESGLLIAAVLSMTAADIALDLISIHIFHAGMFGMGLASSLSYYLAMILGGSYFLSRKCVFRFSRSLITREKIAELFRSGLPAGINMAVSVLLVFSLNRLLEPFGSSAVAAYSVICSIGNSANCITTGIGGVSLTLSGIFFHEEDRTSMRALIGHLCRDALILAPAVSLLVIFFAPYCVSLFLTRDMAAWPMAVRGLRFFALGLLPCCINNALKYAYQASEKILFSEMISVAEGVLFPLAAVFLFRPLWGTDGIWLYFAAGEGLTLLAVAVYILHRTSSLPWKKDACLLLKDSFGASPENTLEMQIGSLQDVAAASLAAQEFCMSRGQSGNLSAHIALCIEEMAGNVVQHGFPRDHRKHHVQVMLMQKDGSWTLRFRDDCGAFDPIHYVPGPEKDALGIRLALSLASEARYTYSVSLNNLVLRLPEEPACASGS